MYNLPYHKEDDPRLIAELIAEFPLAFLSGCTAELRPVVTQVPVFLEEAGGKKVLRGHLMKHTDHHLAFQQNPNVLVVFTGKNTYVSGSWYSNPHTASTWNYMSVHVRGSIRFGEGEEVVDILRKTSLHFEGNNPDSPTVYDQLPDDFKQRVIGAIAAFEIEVESIDTVFKLSQDRDVQSYYNIIDQLEMGDDSARYIAREMKKRQHRIHK